MELKKGLELKQLRDRPDWIDCAADWFSGKWGIARQLYYESMQACIQQKAGVPQWYVVCNARREIIAGAGVIQNDFHQRKDLAPNLCALYVEQNYRRQGIAKYMLDFVRADFGKMGVPALYLITDHMDFYEKCGWTFFAMVLGEDGVPARMYTAETTK